MSYLGQNSKSSIFDNLEEVALKKISEFIAKIHGVLLPRANSKGVFRDLTNDEDYLLTNLEEHSILHSILAGCMAIDSCLLNIFEEERALTLRIISNSSVLSGNFNTLQ